MLKSLQMFDYDLCAILILNSICNCDTTDSSEKHQLSAVFAQRNPLYAEMCDRPSHYQAPDLATKFEIFVYFHNYARTSVYDC